MAGSVIVRGGTTIVDQLIYHDDQLISWEEADLRAGRRLDRRKAWAFIHGELCESVRWTQSCSGCSCDCGCYGDHGNAGCSECGYQGKVRSGQWVPAPSTGGDFVLRRYEVTVSGWGSGIFLAASRGKAMADAWRSDAFQDYSFGEFLKIARCRLTEFQPKPVEITVSGRRALGLGHNDQYAQFVYPGKDVVLHAHPLDVLPESQRPRAYRGRAA